MNKKETEVILQRIENWYNRIQDLFIYDQKAFQAEYGWSKEPVSFNDRLSLDYKPIKEGEPWGGKWESAWFHLTGKVPQEWTGKTVYGDLDFSGEGLVFDNRGIAMQGITNASIWDSNFARTRVPLIDACNGGDDIDIWVEAAANSLFGVFTDPDPAENSPKRYGWFDAKVEKINFGIFDATLWNLYLDARILRGLIKHLDKNSVRRSRAILALNNCIDEFRDDSRNALKANECLHDELNKNSSESDLDVSAIGHAHIDTGWLWPVRETIRKCGRTFATQLNLIDKYPEYVFGASQPQHYAFIKEYYPEIYERIKNAVSSGNWELQGGMWIEADCNLISGESMVRQLLHGKNFFKDEFDIEVDNLWLPDVFGYSAALPQILRKAGVNYFLTQKLSWSQFNEFPHHTFNWRGIDGTEVLTHFPPENTYNSELDTEFLMPAQTGFKEKDKLNEFISLFGVGDGGGGPKPENIELGRRMSNLENSPRVKFDSAKNFFHRLDDHREKLDTWVGELYLELHRGTLTTHGLVKKQNRKLEYKLRAVEMLWSCLPLSEYPNNEFDLMWKKLLLNQFHDIIPGSSINLVYQTTHAEYDQIHRGCDELMDNAAKMLFEEDENSFVLVNNLSYVWKGTIKVPDGFRGYSLFTEDEKNLEIQAVGEETYASVELEPLSFKTIKRGDKLVLNDNGDQSNVLENSFIKYKFENGTLVSIFDKTLNKEFLSGIGNIISLYEDRPNNWDAWDIDFFYRNALMETATLENIESIHKGNVFEQIKFKFSIGSSKIEQTVILSAHSKRLDFKTSVEWKERHKMLRVHFPVSIRHDQASYDIQYGYVKRNTHRNTSWDKAKFEVVGHKYVDLSDNDHGIALMNDCKYGHMVHDNLLDLNLLRSPTNPDPDADKGSHSFTYSVFPHDRDLIHSDVIRESTCLNQEPILFTGYKTELEFPVKLFGDGLELSVLKKAEKEDCLIIRIIETLGKRSKGSILINGTITECDLMEWNEVAKPIILEGELEINLTPFEIRTYKVAF